MGATPKGTGAASTAGMPKRLHGWRDKASAPCVGEHAAFVGGDAILSDTVYPLFMQGKAKACHVFVKGGTVSPVGIDHPDF